MTWYRRKSCRRPRSSITSLLSTTTMITCFIRYQMLYAPGLTSRHEIVTVVKSVDRPLNVLMGLANNRLTVADLAEMGVRRISIGSALSRTALAAFLRAAHEMRNQGTFTFADDAVSYSSMNAMFGRC